VHATYKLRHKITVYFEFGPAMHSITLDTKLLLYMSIVIPTALHACETWKSISIIRQKLDVFNQRCLRTILGILWRDHITNDEVLRRVHLGSLSEIVRQRRLRFAGHILRLPENRPAYMAINWKPDNGRRRPGDQRRPGGQHSMRTYMI